MKEDSVPEENNDDNSGDTAARKVPKMKDSDDSEEVKENKGRLLVK